MGSTSDEYDRLREVKPFFQDLTPSGRMALVSKVRADRSVRKVIPREEKAKKRAKQNKLDKTAAILRKINPDIVKELLDGTDVDAGSKS